mmetsp:Transcript_31858/g.97336  ORF Transcript_31858/g.97336 Transcript_31858/m.97336 type:complete len:93 (-) Transcript_31858:228-506(-)|eukprot:scaffold222055_cov32-Tisochrysis_lutea.AAC.1
MRVEARFDVFSSTAFFSCNTPRTMGCNEVLELFVRLPYTGCTSPFMYRYLTQNGTHQEATAFNLVAISYALLLYVPPLHRASAGHTSTNLWA